MAGRQNGGAAKDKQVSSARMFDGLAAGGRGLVEDAGRRPPRNMATAMRHLHDVPLRWNRLRGEAQIEAEGEWRALTEADVRRHGERLQSVALDVSLPTVRDALIRCAECREHDPLRDWLDGLPPWDGVVRIDRLFVDYWPADLPPAEPADRAEAARLYVETLARCWMIGAVARVFEPGCDLDVVPVLIGDVPRIDELLDTLVPRVWLRWARGQPRPREAGQYVFGSWITVLRHEARDDNLRSVVDMRSDRGPRGVSVLRRCAFLAVRDEIDCRFWAPFWPVTLRLVEVHDRLARDRDQLWAEAVAAYRGGSPWLVGQRLDHPAARSGLKCRVEHFELYASLSDWLDRCREADPDWEPHFTIEQAQAALDWHWQDPEEERRVLAEVLREAFGFHSRRCWRGEHRGRWMWSR